MNSLVSANLNLKKIRQENLSTISEIESELHKKSDTIINLNRDIASLQNCRPILEEAKRIQDLNEKKEAELVRREKNISAYEKIVRDKLERAKEYEDKHKKILDDVESEVENRAVQKIALTTKQLKNEYAEKITHKTRELNRRYLKRVWFYRLTFTYCTIWILIQLFTSKALMKEFLSIGIWLYDYSIARIGNIKTLTIAAAGITDKIPNETVADISYRLILIIVGTILIALFFGVPLLIVWLISKYLRDGDKFDKVNRWIMVSTGMTVISISQTGVCNIPTRIMFIC